jgi:outer membrane murein-binding lipoprotein Lpp
MNQFEMVVMIVAIVVIGRVLSGRMQGRRGRMQTIAGDIQDDSKAVAEAARLRNEVNRLNERIQVLERLATDPAKRLSDEIDSLKNQ